MTKKSQKKPIVLPEKASAKWKIKKVLTDQVGGQGQPVLVEDKNGNLGVFKQLLHINSDTAHKRLKQEIKILNKISHENIIKLLDYNVEDKIPWYITPKYTPLESYWSEKIELLTTNELVDLSLKIINSILNGLAEIHGQKLVHRDIKPGNIIIDELKGDVPKIIDFGLVYVPNTVRITDIKNDWPVCNTFAAHPAAYYGNMETPPPWWDCICVANLWGWMLNAGSLKAYSHQHPRYHIFKKGDERCNLIRSFWLSTSVEELGPRNASEAIEILKKLGLRDCEKSSGSVGNLKHLLVDKQKSIAIDKEKEAINFEKAIASSGILLKYHEPITNWVKDFLLMAERGQVPLNGYDSHFIEANIKKCKPHTPENSTILLRVDRLWGARRSFILETWFHEHAPSGAHPYCFRILLRDEKGDKNTIYNYSVDAKGGFFIEQMIHAPKFKFEEKIDVVDLLQYVDDWMNGVENE